MASEGSTASKTYPTETAENLRTCIASGRQQPKFDMVRFVIGPDHRPVPDLEEKLPGRGLWLSAERHVIHTACIKNLFADLLKGSHLRERVHTPLLPTLRLRPCCLSRYLPCPIRYFGHHRQHVLCRCFWQGLLLW